MKKIYKRGKIIYKLSFKEHLQIFYEVFTEIPEDLNELRLDIIDFITDIRYKVDKVIDKLYGLEKEPKDKDGFVVYYLEKRIRNDKLEEEWRQKHPVIDYLISLYHGFVYDLPRTIDMFPRKVYWFIQRGKRGYSDSDVWGFEGYLSRTIAGGISYLRKNLHSHPEEITFSQWKKILKQIEEGFELVQEGNYITLNEYLKDEKRMKRLRRENKDWIPTKTEVKKMDKAFKLFKEYFGHLWD